MDKHLSINLSGFNVKHGAEEDFFKWYNGVHVPMLLKCPGLQRITEYEITKLDTKYPRFLTILEFADGQAFEAYSNSHELAEAHKDAIERSTQNRDRDAMWRVQYKAIKSWGK